MTPQTRAEKIVGIVLRNSLCSEEELAKAIAAQIEKAEREAVKEAFTDEIRTGAQLQAKVSDEMRRAKFEEFINERENNAYAEGFRAGQNHDFIQSPSTEDRIKGIAESIRTSQSMKARLAVLRNLCEQAKQEGFNAAREKACKECQEKMK